MMLSSIPTFLTLFLLATTLGSAQSQDDDTDTELIEEFLNSDPSPPIPVKPDPPPPPPPSQESKIPLQISKGPEKAPHQPPKEEEGDRDGGGGGGSSEETFIEPQVSGGKGSCKCVKYYLCNIDNGTVVDNGDVLGLIDIRLGASKPSACPHYFDICCPDSKQESEVPKNAVPPPTKTFEHSVCGKRNVGGVGFRITGADDNESQFSEFPWMAAIVRQEQQGGKPSLNIYLCGGSLIHPQVILTAAHCVYGKEPDELKVRLGEWDTQTPHELYPHQDRFVNKIIVHQAYYSGALFNDIALLILNEPVKFAPNVDTICLPPPNLKFDGQTCYASGWGKNTFGQDGKYQVILKKVELPVVPTEQCQQAMRKTRLGPHFKLHNSFVCAGGEAGRDTCRGDGGSPLVCRLPDSQYYAQVGIVSWGLGCGQQGIPGVYVNVPLLAPWIADQMRRAKMETTFFKN